MLITTQKKIINSSLVILKKRRLLWGTCNGSKQGSFLKDWKKPKYQAYNVYFVKAMYYLSCKAD